MRQLIDVNVASLLERLGIAAKKSGKEWSAKCPLHNDRTPSWFMHDEPGSDRNGLWKCYGCGAVGGPTTIVSNLLGLEWAAAKDWIASNARADDATIFDARIVTEWPTKKFQIPVGGIFSPMEMWAQLPRSYLQARGVTADHVERWGLGYAVSGRLAGRIVIPVHDFKQKLVGYTARTFVNDPKKYLEPNMHECAEHGTIFGECYWPSMSDRWRVVIVEGAFDAISVEDATELPIAALRGSQLHPRHIAKLATFKNIIIATDPDPAGNKAAAALTEALSSTSTIRRVVMPAGHDVASYALAFGMLQLAHALDVQPANQYRTTA